MHSVGERVYMSGSGDAAAAEGDFVMAASIPEKGCTVCMCDSYSRVAPRTCECGHREPEHAPCSRKQFKFPADQLDRRCGECGLYPSSHVEAEHAPCTRKQYQFPIEQFNHRCGECGLYPSSHVAAEDAPCSLTKEDLLSDPPDMRPNGRCSACGLGVGRHASMPPKRPRDDEDNEILVHPRRQFDAIVHPFSTSGLSIVTGAHSWAGTRMKRKCELWDFPPGFTRWEYTQLWKRFRDECVQLTGVEEHLQALWNKFALSALLPSECAMCDTSESPCLQPFGVEDSKLKKKADLCIVPKDMKPSELTVFSVIELKAPNHQLTDTDRAEVLDYLTILMQHQESRRVAYGALENGHHMVLFKLARDGEGLFLGYTDELTGDELLRALYWLVFMPMEERGLDVVTVDEVPYHRIKLLGRGSSCSAYKCLSGDDTVVLKHYKDTDSSWDHFDHEVSAMERLSHACVPHVPTKVSASFPYMAVKPRGHSFSLSRDAREKRLFKFEHCQQLLDCLKQAHHSGIVHRDVRPDNFFFVDGAGTLLLNDWGASAEIGTHVRHQGCPENYRHRYIDPAEEYGPFPNQDLYSFVLSVCHIVTGYRPASDSAPPEAWRRVLECTVGNGDPAYDAVLQGIRALM